MLRTGLEVVRQGKGWAASLGREASPRGKWWPLARLMAKQGWEMERSQVDQKPTPLRTRRAESQHSCTHESHGGSEVASLHPDACAGSCLGGCSL